MPFPRQQGLGRGRHGSTRQDEKPPTNRWETLEEPTGARRGAVAHDKSSHEAPGRRAGAPSPGIALERPPPRGASQMGCWLAYEAPQGVHWACGERQGSAQGGRHGATMASGSSEPIPSR